ncbi:MAG: YceD family protein [Pseudohongiellaceae bacterium]
MSTTPLPEYVDQRKIFTQQGDISGFVEFANLARLSECLTDGNGKVYVKLGFEVDGSGRKVIHVSLEAQAKVICQRCLEPMLVELADQVNLVVINDESAAVSLDRQFDPWLCTDHKIDLINLVDEQMVLCMPIVNLHQSGPCVTVKTYDTKASGTGKVPGAEGVPEKRNPFAVLEKLQKY